MEEKKSRRIVITSKQAKEHIANIKSETNDMMSAISLHKQRIINDSVRERQLQIDSLI